MRCSTRKYLRSLSVRCYTSKTSVFLSDGLSSCSLDISNIRWVHFEHRRLNISNSLVYVNQHHAKELMGSRALDPSTKYFAAV